MLVIHPSSTCDVCLECYSGNSESLPYSISCGHVFCLSCLQSLRRRNCPLCRSSFEASDVRRLHVDRTNSPRQAPLRAPSPSRSKEDHPTLPDNNALGLFNDIPLSIRLQEKISDLVLKSSFTNGIRERGVRDLIQEIHTFLSSEPIESHSNLRAPFLLLYRFTDLQSRYQQLENSAFDLRTANNRDKQSVADWERRYQDLLRSRTRDQDSARIVEESLRERLRIEELEWQRKCDLISSECASLRDELHELRFSSSKDLDYHPPHLCQKPVTGSHFIATNTGANTSTESKRDQVKGLAPEEYRAFNPDLFHISPAPGTISLSSSNQSSDSGNGMAIRNHKRGTHEPHDRTSSTTSNISRASDSAAAMKPFSTIVPIPFTTNRQRSDSNPCSRSEKVKAYHFERQPEVSSSAPNSYDYRSTSPTRTLFPATPPPYEIDSTKRTPRDGEVMRLYSMLEKPALAAASRFANSSSYLTRTRTSTSGFEEHIARPPMPRSMSFQQTRSTEYNTTSSLASTPPSVSQTPSSASHQMQSYMQAHTSRLSSSQSREETSPTSSQESTQAISPIQRTPPRPVLPHMHSCFSLYSSAFVKPDPSQEIRAGVRGPLPRRGSLSSAGAAAAAQATPYDRETAQSRRNQGHGALATTSGSPAIVPPSSLGTSNPHGRDRIWGGQDSD